MSPHRCQICGRRKHLRKDGGIAHHHVQGAPCAGIGHPPIELDDARLVDQAAQASREYLRLSDAIRELEDRRANFIDPALIRQRNASLSASIKLDRRLRRHQGWAARYARAYERDMYLQGCTWADKPPNYLIGRFLRGIDRIPDAYLTSE